MLMRWTPFNDAAFDLDRFFPLVLNGNSKEPTIWHPAVDVHEDAERILLIADLPGLEQSDVNITIDKNILTLKGERKRENKTEEKGAYSYERSYGQFSRAFTLPSTIDVDGVTAEMKAGVLTVTLPKKPESKPKQISVISTA